MLHKSSSSAVRWLLTCFDDAIDEIEWYDRTNLRRVFDKHLSHGLDRLIYEIKVKNGRGVTALLIQDEDEYENDEGGHLFHPSCFDALTPGHVLYHMTNEDWFLPSDWVVDEYHFDCICHFCGKRLVKRG